MPEQSMNGDVEAVTDPGALIGEGPSWDYALGEMLWVDILNRQVHTWRPGRVQTTDTYEQQVGAVVPRAGGGRLLAMEDGFWTTDAEGVLTQLAAVEADKPHTRMNDGKCDRRGRFWAGTMAHDARTGAGSLYRLDTDGNVQMQLAECTISNGIGWSPDDSTMYYIDSAKYRVDRFAYNIDSGDVSNHQVAFDLSPELGIPDGLAVDSDGCIWIAFYQGWSVRRFSPRGEEVTALRLPVSNVTSCAFGGTDLSHLFITTACNGLNEAELSDQPLAGALFVHSAEVPGLPEVPFAG